MLMPKRTKYRKPHRLSYEGHAKGNTELHFGEYGLKALEDQIDVIKSMQIGKNIDNDEYDAILISEFESLEDLQKYKTDPRHVRVSNMCKEIRTKRTAFDFEE